MFTASGRQQIIVSGGTFVHTDGSSISEGFKILHENIAIGAFHDSLERYDPPKCHPNTRLAVLAEIMRWIQIIEELKNILWLYGPAGAGKSAIAQTVAERCAALGLLVASFFFSRTFPSRNNGKCLIASIAYQLAIFVPATRSYIESAVQTDPAIFNKSLDTQMETLIIRPLVGAYAHINPVDAKQWPKLIIIDGLDECHDPSVQSFIIRRMSKALRRIPVPLMLLVASRPEPHIRSTFNLLIKSEPHISYHIVLDDSYEPDVDIKEFLLSQFNEIRENHQLAAYIPQSWPSERIVDRLVRKSSGQFIYASTVMKYLNSPKHRPMKRLNVILGLIPVDGDMPYKELDALYSHIFSSIADVSTTLKLLGFLFFKYNIEGTLVTPDFLADLLGSDREDVDLHLSELHSILYIPPPNPSGYRFEIRPTHASLQDFLVDKLRSGKYYLDEEAFHTDLARQCVRHISTLSMDQASQFRRALDLGSYLIFSFIYHCTSASTESANLKDDIMRLRDLRPWFEISSPNFAFLSTLFAWLNKADTAAKELSSHFQSLWDQYLISKLNEHKFNGTNVDIAGLLFLPQSSQSRWFYLFHLSQVPTIFTKVEDDLRILPAFFEDKIRSGKYHVDGTVYAHAVLEFFRNMLFVSVTEDTTSQQEIDFLCLEGLTTLLYRAAPSNDLYFYLRDHPLQNVTKVKVDSELGFSSLNLAVKVYLEKCKDLVPKVLRRSASCSLYPSYMNLEPNLEKLRGTFNEQRSFAIDSNTIFTGPPVAREQFRRTKSLEEMRNL